MVMTLRTSLKMKTCKEWWKEMCGEEYVMVSRREKYGKGQTENCVTVLGTESFNKAQRI